jgi:hypothetical protein
MILLRYHWLSQKIKMYIHQGTFRMFKKNFSAGILFIYLFIYFHSVDPYKGK